MMRVRTFTAVVLLVSLTACSSMQRIPADRFAALASKPSESMFASGYVGYMHGAHESKMRVYLWVSRMGLFRSWSHELYWTPLSEFPGEVVAQILAGQDPWTRTGRELPFPTGSGAVQLDAAPDGASRRR